MKIRIDTLLVVLLIAAILWLYSIASNECDSKGGVLIMTPSGSYCVNKSALR